MVAFFEGCEPLLQRRILRLRAEEAQLAPFERGDVRRGQQLGIADHKRRGSCWQRCPDRVQSRERRLDRDDVVGVAVERLPAERDRSVAGDPEARVELPFDRPLRRAAISDLRESVLLVGVAARERQLRHVPVQFRKVKTEHLDRTTGNEVEDLVEMPRDRVQRAAQPIIVQLDGRHTEYLLHREPLPPIGERRQRPRIRQPVTHKRLEHLAVRQIRDRPDRTEPIHRLNKPKPVAQPLHDRQGARRPHHKPTLTLHTTSFATHPRVPAPLYAENRSRLAR